MTTARYRKPMTTPAAVTTVRLIRVSRGVRESGVREPADASHDLLGPEWFDDVIVDAGVERSQDVAFLRLRREHDHGHTLPAGRLADLCDQLEPAYVRQHDVHDD